MSDPPDTLNVTHFGTEYSMVDYTSNSTHLYFTTTYNQGSKFSAFGTLSYTMSKAEIDEVVMPDLEGVLVNSVTGEAELTHQDFTFPHMHEYSDLEYSLIGFHAGFEYMLFEGWTFTLDGQYYDLSDDAGGWVFGDESGSMFMVRSGVRYSF